MNICEHLTRTAQLFPERAALIYENRQMTYAEVARLSAIAAHQLAALGLRRGDRAALLLPNAPSFVVWYYAALGLGAAAVSISTRLAPEEAGFILADSEAKVLVTGNAVRDAMSEFLPDCVEHVLAVSHWADCCGDERLVAAPGAPVDWVAAEPEDPALILYTSGTTGIAKGAVLSHQNVRATVHAFNHLCRMGPEDRLLLSVPLFHCYGQNALLNSGFNVGAALVLQDRFDMNESKRLIAEQRVTKLFGVPTTFQMLEECCTPADLESVDYCFSAAAPLPIQVSSRWQEKFGMPIYEGYGLTETAPFASYNHPLQYIPGSIGMPVDLVEMKIADPETGETSPPNTLGEIAIRGPNVMLGYWNRPEETALAVRDGWFFSGDLGRMDERGYFYIVDRVKDMISVGGLKVFPAEVERILLDHPSVSEAAAVGVPDDVFGEQVVAFVTTPEDVRTDFRAQAELVTSIRRHCQRRLAKYKAPAKIRFLDELPRNPAGKILKRKLRDAFAEASAFHDGSADRLAAGAIRPPTGGPSPADETPGAAQRTNEASTTLHDAEPPSDVERARDWTGPVRLADRLRSTHATQRERVVMELIQDEVAHILEQDVRPAPDAKFIETGLDSLAIVDLRDRLQLHVGSHLELSATMVFDHPQICDLAAYLADSILQDAELPSDVPEALTFASSRGQIATPADSPQTTLPETLCGDLAAMSEDEALRELLRELGA